MKRILLLLWLLNLLNAASAQEDKTLYLTDSQSKLPIGFATLSSEFPKAFVTTDEQGRANASIFKGAEQIIIRSIGYGIDTITYRELERNNFKVSLELSDVKLKKYNVYASYATRLEPDMSTKRTVISAEEIAKQNPQTTADLVANSGDVYVQKSQMGGGSPMIRGFAANRILLTVDGVRMNTAIFRSGNLQNVISLDAFSTAATEIIFGPGSVLYGSDAIGGVIGFKTLEAQFSQDERLRFFGHFGSRYSSANGEKTNHFDFNFGWKKWALLTSVTYSDFGDLKMGSYGPKSYLRPAYAERVNGEDIVVKNDDERIQRPTAYNQLNLMQKVQHQINSNLKLEYAFHYSTTSNTPRYDRLVRFANELPRSAEWYYGPQNWMMNHLSIEYARGTSLFDRMNVSVAQQLFEESRIDRDFADNTRYKRFEDVNAYSLNLDFEKRLNTRQGLFYGVEGVYNVVNSSGVNQLLSSGEELDAESRYPDANWTSSAIYATYQYQLNDQLKIEAGMRYNLYTIDATFDTSKFALPFNSAELQKAAISGSLGMLYNLNATSSIRFNTASGFRAPNVDDMGKVFDSEPGSVVVPNPDLKAEYVYSVELGINKKISNFTFDLSTYHSWLQNSMVRRPYLLNGQDSVLYQGELSGVQAIQNAAISRVYGVMAGLQYEFGVFRAFSRFSYQKGEEELDDGSTSPSRHAAPWFGTTHFIITKKKIQFDVYLNYNGEVAFRNLAVEERGKPYLYATDADGNPYSPGWYTLNVRVSADISSGLMAGIGLENISDQRYRTYSSGIAAAGRNLILSLRASF